MVCAGSVRLDFTDTLFDLVGVHSGHEIVRESIKFNISITFYDIFCSKFHFSSHVKK